MMPMRLSVISQAARLPRKQGRLVFVLIGILALTTGCQNSQVYQAADLPEEFHAPQRLNAKTIDLSPFGLSPSGGEVIHRGDVIEVTIAAGLSANDRVTIPTRVQDNGNVRLPDIGQISVAGLKLAEAENSIHAASVQLGLYRNPLVTITKKTQQTSRVTVLGAVKNPGIHQLPAQRCDLLAAIAAAGGLSDEAGTEVEIHMPETSKPASPSDLSIASTEENGVIPASGTVEPVPDLPLRGVSIDLAFAHSQKTEDFTIPDGAIITVKPRPREFFQVLGLVNHPSRFEFPANEEIRVLDAIAMAEDISMPAADKVHILRQLSHQSTPVVIEVSLRRAMRDQNENLRLAAGDIVSVEHNPSTMMMQSFRGVHLNVQATGH